MVCFVFSSPPLEIGKLGAVCRPAAALLASAVACGSVPLRVCVRELTFSQLVLTLGVCAVEALASVRELTFSQLSEGPTHSVHYSSRMALGITEPK